MGTGKRYAIFILAMAGWVLLYAFVIQPYLMPKQADKKAEETAKEQEKEKEPAVEKEKEEPKKTELASIEDAEKDETSKETEKEADAGEKEKAGEETEAAKKTEKSFFDLYDEKFEYIEDESEQGKKLVYRYSAENGVTVTKIFSANQPSKEIKEGEPKESEPYITNLTILIENNGDVEFKQKGYMISAGTLSSFDPEPKITDMGIFAQSASTHYFKPRGEVYTDIQGIEGIAFAGITSKYFASILEPATDETRKTIKKVVINSLVLDGTPEKCADGVMDESLPYIKNSSFGAVMQDIGASATNYILFADDVVRGTYDENGKIDRHKNLAYQPAVIPLSNRPFAISAVETESKKGAKEKMLQYSLALGTGEIIVPSEETIEHKYRLYVGPKEYRRLKKIGFEKAMHFNRFLGPINIALLAVLHWFYSIIPNYGVAILLLTIVIKIILWPLDQKSYKSMKEMQKIQPLIAEVKAKYKDDPKKAQLKQMELFREHKVNPLGGCLPMLLQFPILIAMFSALRAGFELRGAPFLLWINDLSRPDVLIKFEKGFWFIKSLNILPLLMVVVFYLQQKMSSTAPKSPDDPQYQQQKMMNRIFPIMFGFIFYNMQSGLTLYFTFSTLLRIAQQLLVIKKQESPTASAAV